MISFAGQGTRLLSQRAKKSYWLELGKSLVRQVKPSLSWTMRILCSPFYVLDDDSKEVPTLSWDLHTFDGVLKIVRVRRGAYQALYATYEQLQTHLMLKLYKPMLKYKTTEPKFATTRVCSSCSLAANFVPESVYDNLVAAVRKHLPLCIVTLNFVQRFWEFQTLRCTMSTHRFHLLNIVLLTRKL